jgi:hypothetical protein
MFSKLVGWKRYAAMAFAFLALIAIIVVGVQKCKQIDRDIYNDTVNVGVVKEREETKTEVLNRVEQGRDAVDNPTSAELNRVCDKYDRNCQGNL